MMLRAVVLALLVANLAFYAWTKGWLDPVAGTRAIGDREPERLARQVTPDAVRVLTPRVARGGAGPIACLEAGPFPAAQASAAEAALQGIVPAAGWTEQRTDTPPVWTVYMGRFPNREVLLRKLEELERLRVPFREVVTPAELAPGVSLGRFDDRAAAEKALAEFTARGVRTARVAELAPATSGVTLRIERADPVLRARLAALPEAVMLGRAFTACGTPPGANAASSPRGSTPG